MDGVLVDGRVDGWMDEEVGGQMNRILGCKEEIWDPSKIPTVAGHSIAYLKEPNLTMGMAGGASPCALHKQSTQVLGQTLYLKEQWAWPDRWQSSGWRADTGRGRLRAGTAGVPAPPPPALLWPSLQTRPAGPSRAGSPLPVDRGFRRPHHTCPFTGSFHLAESQQRAVITSPSYKGHKKGNWNVTFKLWHDFMSWTLGTLVRIVPGRSPLSGG